MKRSGPPERRTPLRSTTPLARTGTPLARAGPIRPRRRMVRADGSHSAAWYTARADTLFSLYIRARDGWKCQRCGDDYRERRGRLQCAHIISRGAHPVRWDERNAVAMCGRCHEYLTWHDAEKHLWERDRIGARVWWELHRIGARTGVKLDRAAIVADLEKKVLALGEKLPP